MDLVSRSRRPANTCMPTATGDIVATTPRVRRLLHYTVPAALLAMVTACGGGASSGTPSGVAPGASLTQPESGTDAATSTATPAPVNTDTETETDADIARDSTGISSTTYFRAPDYPEIVTLPLQFLETRSGKKLSVRVTMPAQQKGVPAEGPFPVVLIQSAYNTNVLGSIFDGVPGSSLLGAADPFLVRRGYIQVSVDALGTGVSEGGWELLGENEQRAYEDTVDWVKAQPWFNGKLGVAGVSYMAITSLFTAQRRPDDVQAVFASLPMGDPMRGIVGTGGMINAVFMAKWMSITQILSTQNVTTALFNPRYMSQIINTTQEHVDQVDNYYLPMIDGALNGDPTYTFYTDYWRERSPIENIDKIKAPTFIFGTLHDLFQRDEPLLYERLKQNGVDSRLVIYDGNHFGNFVTQHISNGEVPPIDYLMIQWFDKYLKGIDSNTESIPQVVQHIQGYPSESTPQALSNDSYASTTQWPHPQAKAERWYLHGDNSLTREQPTAEEPVNIMTNPEHPEGGARNSDGLLVFEVEINDGTECSRSYEQWTLGLTLPKTCFRNSELTPQQRVSYETAPMEEDYYINGPIQADVWISSTVTEAVVSVYIEEVSSRQTLPLTNGQLLASVRAVDESRSRFMDGQMIQPYHYFTEEVSQPLVPGEVVKMQVEIFPTSALISKGNRLRISVSPSNQAQGMLNYPRQDTAEGGVTTIHHSPQYPSSVVLPVVPLSALN